MNGSGPWLFKFAKSGQWAQKVWRRLDINLTQQYFIRLFSLKGSSCILSCSSSFAQDGRMLGCRRSCDVEWGGLGSSLRLLSPTGEPCSSSPTTLWSPHNIRTKGSIISLACFIWHIVIKHVCQSFGFGWQIRLWLKLFYLISKTHLRQSDGNTINVMIIDIKIKGLIYTN